MQYRRRNTHKQWLGVRTMGVPFVLLLGFAPLQKPTYHGKGLCITHTRFVCFWATTLDGLYVIYSVWLLFGPGSRGSRRGGGGARKKKKKKVGRFFFFFTPPPPGSRTKQALHRNGLCVRGNRWAHCVAWIFPWVHPQYNLLAMVFPWAPWQPIRFSCALYAIYYGVYGISSRL